MTTLDKIKNGIGINVLSLCDGMSGGQIALKELGIKVSKYYASEIKEAGINVTQLNFPNTIQIGDVNDFNIEMINGDKIDLFLCGSPCQNMSFINKTTRNGLNGEKSSLFYKCVEIMNEVQPEYFFFENVASMKNKDRDTISNYLGVQPIRINADLVSAQVRNRYYWTNIPNIEQPKDRNIKLKDIREYNVTPEEKWSNKKINYVTKRIENTIYAKSDDNKKSIPLTATGYSRWNTQYLYDNGRLRDLTIKEYRRLQTIPDWYDFGNLRKSKIIDLIGDGWCIEVIKHILNNLKGE